METLCIQNSTNVLKSRRKNKQKKQQNKQVNESLLQYRYPGYAFAIGEQKTVVFVSSTMVSHCFVHCV